MGRLGGREETVRSEGMCEGMCEAGLIEDGVQASHRLYFLGDVNGIWISSKLTRLGICSCGAYLSNVSDFLRRERD